jgi:hypothetical protein
VINEVKILIESVNKYIGLFTPLFTAIAAAYVVLNGVNRLRIRKNKHEKYWTLTSRVVNTRDGNLVYTIPDSDIIKSLIDEKQVLQNDLAKQKAENKLLKKQYDNFSGGVILGLILFFIVAFFFNTWDKTKQIFSRSTKTDEENKN